MDDGRELPLFKLETTSESHPFYTGTQKSVDNLGGRVEKFRNKFAHGRHQEVKPRRQARSRQPRLPFLSGAAGIDPHAMMPRTTPTRPS